MLHVLRTIHEFRAYREKAGGGVMPFVPTMGALHAGHGALVKFAREMAGGQGTVLTSVFVNPTQFGPAEDFSKYPRTFEADCALLEREGADAVFAPAADEMYGPNSLAIAIDPGPLATILEGAIRPGHFRGVCTVVAKLLNIVQPTHLILGQKDFQQQAILRQMCLDLNFPVEVITRPTIREPDGLAMSSRNRYLSTDERARAIALYEALAWAKAAYEAGERRTDVLERGMHEKMAARGIEVQYAVVRHTATLAEFPSSTIQSPAVLLVAGKLGTARLIDNMPP